VCVCLQVVEFDLSLMLDVLVLVLDCVQASLAILCSHVNILVAFFFQQ
jgi:hypothetical protein